MASLTPSCGPASLPPYSYPQTPDGPRRQNSNLAPDPKLSPYICRDSLAFLHASPNLLRFTPPEPLGSPGRAPIAPSGPTPCRVTQVSTSGWPSYFTLLLLSFTKLRRQRQLKTLSRPGSLGSSQTRDTRLVLRVDSFPAFMTAPR